MTPILESFFVVHKIINPDTNGPSQKSQQPSQSRPATKPISGITVNSNEELMNQMEQTLQMIRNSSDLNLDDMFQIICSKNKKVINMMIRKNLNLLNESLSQVIKRTPQIIDFENKRNYFKQELKKIKDANKDRSYQRNISDLYTSLSL